MLSIVGLAGWAVLAADPVVVSKGVQQFNQVADMPQCHVVGKVPRGWQWHVGTWSWNPSAAFSISHIAFPTQRETKNDFGTVCAI